jgi:predicted Zn-dependent protease
MTESAVLAAEQDFIRAEAELSEDNTVAALASLEKGLKLKNEPRWYSHLGYCIAKERGQARQGMALCHASLEHEPENPVHYLHLGRIHLLSGNKEEALRAFRDDRIMQKLIELGMRKPLLFPSLTRRHPLNRYIGLLLTRLGIR